MESSATKEELIKWVDKIFNLNKDNDIDYTLYLILFYAQRDNKTKEVVQILLDKGYTILEMVEWYFNNLKIVTESHPYGLSLMNNVINYADLKDIVSEYGDKKYFDLWYDSITLTQI